MSVLECDRTGCDQIMCSRLILDRSMYICESCFSEMQQARKGWPEEMTEVELQRHIEAFMRTEPGSQLGKLSGDALGDAFERMTRSGRHARNSED